MKTLFVLSSLAWAFLLALPAGATTYVLKPDGSGDFPTIQAAIAAGGDGDVLELTDGTFTGDGNRDLDYLGKSITIRSLGGRPDACIIDCQGSVVAPHRGFYFHSGEGPASVLEGVTVKNGFTLADTPFPSGSSGAGMLCTDNSSPTLTNCVFLLNEAGGTGGGMLCLNSSPTLNQCTFSSNTSQSGGGMLLFDSANPILNRCVFSGNSSGGAGGGMACGQSSPTLTECVFSANSSGKNGGAIWLWDSSSPTVSGCSFSGNSAGDNWAGGGMSCEGSSSPRLAGCTFSDSFAGYGGGVSCFNLSSPVLTSCSLFRNRAVQIGGGIYSTDSSSPQLETCTLSTNSAELGGGMGSYGSSVPMVTNCTFSGNTAAVGSGSAAVESASLTLSHTIVAFGIQGEAVACGGTSSTSLSCCDLFGNPGGNWVGCIAAQIAVNGNFSEDPLFCDRSSENFGLRGNSPCAPDLNPACGLIGARAVSCATPTLSTTWGRIKAERR